MITANQLIAHAVGDYVIQSDWMANHKTKRSIAAFVHVITYALPFLFLTLDPAALALIGLAGDPGPSASGPGILEPRRRG